MSKQDNKSQFDMGMTLKKSHQDQIQALRVVNVKNYVQDYYSRVLPVYDMDGSVISAKFYQDNTRAAYKVSFVPNTSNVLLGKYFTINTGGNRKKFYLWFDNSANEGVDPSILGRTGIRVEIEDGDSAAIVAFAVASALKLTQEFNAVTNGYTPVLEITSVEKGYADPINAGNSGFTVTVLEQGRSNLIKEVTLTQVPSCKYVYNEMESTFELLPVGSAFVDADGNLITSSTVGDKQALDVMVAGQVVWDEILTTFPSETSELYTYKKDSNILQTVLVQYANTNKKIILSLTKTSY
jgi:hypothetical protein